MGMVREKNARDILLVEKKDGKKMTSSTTLSYERGKHKERKHIS